jgi:predicted porin
MQKKIIALAIASAISAPALADNANVTIYGKAFLNVEAASNDKSTNATRVQTNASRLGVKGSEDLGEGLKGIYQFELEMDADGSGNTVSTTATGTGTPAAATYTSTPTASGLGKSRNSGVGLEGGFGKVVMGVWDTPFKVAHNKIELFDNTTSFTATKVIGRTYNAKDYNSRQKNSVNYWSPTFAGVQIAAALKADETTNYKNSVSASATFETEELYVSAAYENRPDQTTATTADTAARLVAKYSLGDFWLGAAYESLVTNTSTTASATQTNAELAGSVKFGASSLGLAYVAAGTPSVTGASVTNYSATQISVRYGYNFSKRTEVFAAYSTLKNDANVKYSLVTAVNGATENVAGVGIIHSF